MKKVNEKLGREKEEAIREMLGSKMEDPRVLERGGAHIFSTLGVKRPGVGFIMSRTWD